MQHVPLWLGLTCCGGVVAIVVFIVFAFRQGLKVKNPPEGVPPQHTANGLSS
jgi:hypothetical protein